MEGYMTIKQAAKKWDVTPRRIQKLCTDGRIEGATKFGRDWAIPADAAKPVILTASFGTSYNKQLKIHF